jgi:hypothetical protein
MLNLSKKATDINEVFLRHPQKSRHCRSGIWAALAPKQGGQSGPGQLKPAIDLLGTSSRLEVRLHRTGWSFMAFNGVEDRQGS